MPKIFFYFKNYVGYNKNFTQTKISGNSGFTRNQNTMRMDETNQQIDWKPMKFAIITN